MSGLDGRLRGAHNNLSDHFQDRIAMAGAKKHEIAVHYRTSDYAIDGEKYLLVQEWQSDLFQAIQKGVRRSSIEVYNQLIETTPYSGTSNWVALAFRHALDDVIKDGSYKGIAWLTGRRQTQLEHGHDPDDEMIISPYQVKAIYVSPAINRGGNVTDVKQKVARGFEQLTIKTKPNQNLIKMLEEGGSFLTAFADFDRYPLTAVEVLGKLTSLVKGIDYIKVVDKVVGDEDPTVSHYAFRKGIFTDSDVIELTKLVGHSHFIAKKENPFALFQDKIVTGAISRQMQRNGVIPTIAHNKDLGFHVMPITKDDQKFIKDNGQPTYAKSVELEEFAILPRAEGHRRYFREPPEDVIVDVQRDMHLRKEALIDTRERLREAGVTIEEAAMRVVGTNSLGDLRITNITATIENEGFTVSAGYLNQPIYDIVREINFIDKTVTHTNLKVNPAYQAKGLVKKVMREAMDLYQQLGMESIELVANVDVGAYAWVRYGFLPTQEEWNHVRESLSDNLSILKYREDNNISIEEARFVQFILRRDDVRSIRQLAAYKQSDGRLLGKDLLRKVTWTGALDFKDKESMELFDSYVGQEVLKLSREETSKGVVIEVAELEKEMGVEYIPEIEEKVKVLGTTLSEALEARRQQSTQSSLLEDQLEDLEKRAEKFSPLPKAESVPLVQPFYSSLVRLIEQQRPLDKRNGKQWSKYLITQGMSEVEMRALGVSSLLQKKLDKEVTKDDLLVVIEKNKVVEDSVLVQGANWEVTRVQWYDINEPLADSAVMEGFMSLNFSLDNDFQILKGIELDRLEGDVIVIQIVRVTTKKGKVTYFPIERPEWDTPEVHEEFKLLSDAQHYSERLINEIVVHDDDIKEHSDWRSITIEVTGTGPFKGSHTLGNDINNYQERLVIIPDLYKLSLRGLKKEDKIKLKPGLDNAERTVYSHFDSAVENYQGDKSLKLMDIVSHIRTTDYHINDEKYLLIQELQSDYYQELHDTYGHDVENKAYKKFLEKAPYAGTNNWVSLTFRHVLDAVVQQGGYKGIAWLDGDVASQLQHSFPAGGMAKESIYSLIDEAGKFKAFLLDSDVPNSFKVGEKPASKLMYLRLPDDRHLIHKETPIAIRDSNGKRHELSYEKDYFIGDYRGDEYVIIKKKVIEKVHENTVAGGLLLYQAKPLLSLFQD